MQAYGRDILFKVMDTIVEISKEQERRIMQIEMIKNFYPEYTENNYVLWIIPNLFTDSETTHINGKIKVIKDGDALDIPIVSNSPYPNKKVCFITRFKTFIEKHPFLLILFQDLNSLTALPNLSSVSSPDCLQSCSPFLKRMNVGVDSMV